MTAYDDKKIRTRQCPVCYLCGTRGEILYEGLQDRLFGAAGRWNLKKCLNPQCGLVWLEPIPIEEDIWKAYTNYYTHQDAGRSRGNWLLKSLFRYGLKGAWNLFLHATPIHRERKRLYLMYLDKSKPGRLLEVGCGNGIRLARFRARGWEVEGQEVDVKAADFARRRYGLKVHVGLVGDLPIEDATFDAIIMNHVIEHVHSPEILLANCRRLLKRTGKLIVVTPNIESLGHKKFSADWRDLDPPRHIRIFSCKTLSKMAGEARFSQWSVWTTAANAQIIAAGSLDNRRHGRHVTRGDFGLSTHIVSILFQLYARIVCAARKNSGEECVLRAVR